MDSLVDGGFLLDGRLGPGGVFRQLGFQPVAFVGNLLGLLFQGVDLLLNFRRGGGGNHGQQRTGQQGAQHQHTQDNGDQRLPVDALGFLLVVCRIHS